MLKIVWRGLQVIKLIVQHPLIAVLLGLVFLFSVACYVFYEYVREQREQTEQEQSK